MAVSSEVSEEYYSRTHTATVTDLEARIQFMAGTLGTYVHTQKGYGDHALFSRQEDTI
jgi:hypothetical protein